MTKEEFISKYVQLVTEGKTFKAKHKEKQMLEIYQQAARKYHELQDKCTSKVKNSKTLWNKIDKDVVFEASLKSRTDENMSTSTMGTAWQTRTRRGYRNKFGEHA